MASNSIIGMYLLFEYYTVVLGCGPISGKDIDVDNELTEIGTRIEGVILDNCSIPSTISVSVFIDPARFTEDRTKIITDGITEQLSGWDDSDESPPRVWNGYESGIRIEFFLDADRDISDNGVSVKVSRCVWSPSHPRSSMCTNDSYIDIIKIGLRSVASSVPVIGSMATAWGEWESNNRWKRADEFFLVISAQMKDMEEALERQSNYLSSEENLHLLSLTMDHIMREHREEKRKLISNFLVKTMTVGQSISFDEKRFFLDILNDLSEFDIHVLSLFKNVSVLNVDHYFIEKQINSIEEREPYNISITRLHSMGLIKEKKPSSDRGKKAVTTRRQIEKLVYRDDVWELREIGTRFISFILEE